LIIGVSIIGIFGFLVPIDAIPPTNAFEKIAVLIDGSLHNVKSEKWNDQIYLVSDGSIIFNVTQSYP